METLILATKRVLDYNWAASDEDFTEYIQDLIAVLIETFTGIIKSMEHYSP